MQKVVPDDAVLIPDNAERVFRGVIFDIYQWPQPMFNGSTATFEMAKRPDTVTIIAIIDNKILVIDYTQPHVGRKKALPAGRVDPSDTDILSAAKRELKEETGYFFKDWKLLSVKQRHFKIEGFVYYFLASGEDDRVKPELDAGEKIDVSQLAFDEVKDMVMNDVGFLGEARKIFEVVSNIDDLKALPEFKGRLVDR